MSGPYFLAWLSFKKSLRVTLRDGSQLHVSSRMHEEHILASILRRVPAMHPREGVHALRSGVGVDGRLRQQLATAGRNRPCPNLLGLSSSRRHSWQGQLHFTFFSQAAPKRCGETQGVEHLDSKPAGRVRRHMIIALRLKSTAPQASKLTGRGWIYPELIDLQHFPLIASLLWTLPLTVRKKKAVNVM